MTEAELDLIESKLGIALPQAYRNLMRTRAEELAGLTREIRGQKYGWFDQTLIFNANLVIQTNLGERGPNSGTAYVLPGWWETFFLFGGDGGDDYYGLRLIGDEKVWMIGSDGGTPPTVIAESLADFVAEQVREHAETPPWQPPPLLSSFDDSCPLLERFKLFIGREVCQLECQNGDIPVTSQKLQEHGIDFEALGLRALQVVAVLSKCDTSKLTFTADRKASSSGGLMINFSQAIKGDKRFKSVNANLFSGKVYVSLHGPKDKAPPHDKAGIDWPAFQEAVTSLLLLLHPPGTQVRISEPLPSQFDLSNQWNYDFTYALD